MKKQRSTEEHIIAVLKEQEAGAKVADVCRKHGISEATFYKLPVVSTVRILKGRNLKPLLIAPALFALVSLGGCTTSSSSNSASAPTSDACGASRYQKLVGGPSSATTGLKIPGGSRHYGREEPVSTNTPSRLNFVHSGTAVESVTNPKSTVIRVFCG